MALCSWTACGFLRAENNKVKQNPEMMSTNLTKKDQPTLMA